MSQGISARSIEREFFRTLNRAVEPMVRAGLGSPRITPGGLVVLETQGRISGRRIRTPLAATEFGRYVIVATIRGQRSQWILNLVAEPKARVWMRGRPNDVRAFVIHEGKRFRMPTSLPSPMKKVVQILAPYREAGWAFAVLTPRESGSKSRARTGSRKS